MNTIKPWYNVVELRQEVREGRSFSPDEFAIALEQVVAGTAPADYCIPSQFFSRTYFTRALRDHIGIVLRRLAGQTQNTAPVLSLVTQFGGGKTHTLTALYHLASARGEVFKFPGVSDLFFDAGLSNTINAKVGVFVGNAWDPSEGRETPWIDLARQIAGNKGVDALGKSAKTIPPGTEAISKVFAVAEVPVLLLFDEVLNFVNRHRDSADKFHAFIQNLTVAVTGSIGTAAVISLPRSQVEMTEWDREWQDRITKIVRRVAKDLITNDETEIGEVIRRRLFNDLGSERIRSRISNIYTNWCFERTARLPSEWTTANSVTKKAHEVLKSRFDSCYPFHPSTLSVFQRKWNSLPQFQQTRGTLAMLAQWISCISIEHFRQARREPLITLGSAPLDVPAFRAVVLGQLGEQKLEAAIESDLAGIMAHARALDSDKKEHLRDIHRRVGTTILFESSGGQVDKVAHLPELRFALGEPEVETTTIDNAAEALEKSGFFIRKIGMDGFKIHHQATLKKVVNERRRSLDEETEIRPMLQTLIKEEFSRAAKIPITIFPKDSVAIQDTRPLTLIVLDPEKEWASDNKTADIVYDWTKFKGRSPRLYPASLIWCVKKTGQELYNRITLWLAWQLVSREVERGLLGPEYDQSDHYELKAKVKESEKLAREEVWNSYTIVALADAKSESSLKIIDLGAGHSGTNETLSNRIISTLKAEGLLNETVSAGYIGRNWPINFQNNQAWPLNSLRLNFLNGSLTRLIDPDKVLRQKIVEFVESGEFGLASGSKSNGQEFQRIWYAEQVAIEEVDFDDSNVFLLTKDKARKTKLDLDESENPIDDSDDDSEDDPQPDTDDESTSVQLSLSGNLPPEMWNYFGTKIIPTLRSDKENPPIIEIHLRVDTPNTKINSVKAKIEQILKDLNIKDQIQITMKNSKGISQ